MATVQELLGRYFRSRAEQLRASSQAAVVEHPGLRGSHREAILSIYLNGILPKRYGVGRGMVYGLGHRSREADIVIWDATNYPSLPLEGHTFFFAESVRAIVEVKSTWSAGAFEDVLAKCRAARDIIAFAKPSLADDMAMLQLEVASLRSGQAHAGMVFGRHHIATSAIVLRGGASLTPDALTDELVADADDAWPDALLLLEPGRVVVKHYVADADGGIGGDTFLEFIDAGDNALLVFTAAFLGLITERSVHVEDPMYLAQYVGELLDGLPSTNVPFPATRPLPGRWPIWER